MASKRSEPRRSTGRGWSTVRATTARQGKGPDRTRGRSRTPELAGVCRQLSPGAPHIERVWRYAPDNREAHLELPVQELLRRARPLPPHDEMVIEDLTEHEGAAFLMAIES